MTELAIAVTIRPGSTPATSTFAYANDGNTLPYLQNVKGDILLPGNKVPVTIRFRLKQTGINVGGKAYKLSLPADSLDIRDSAGKWPPVFDPPKLGGPPGQFDSVEVTDRNDDSNMYKYSFKVDFTPAGPGPVITVPDDPKIRNGGETRGPGPDWTIKQLVFVALVFLIGFALGYWLRGA
jgi:hypothetical protein